MKRVEEKLVLLEAIPTPGIGNELAEDGSAFEMNFPTQKYVDVFKWNRAACANWSVDNVCPFGVPVNLIPRRAPSRR
jgi:hypothetical protein